MTAGIDVATYLANAGQGTLGTDIYVGFIPDVAADGSPINEAMGVMEYGGMMGAQPLDNPMAYEMPRLQVLVRSRSYFTGMEKARTAYTTLGRVVNSVLGGVRYQRIVPVQPPFLIRRDENQRVEIGFNVEIQKEVAANG